MATNGNGNGVSREALQTFVVYVEDKPGALDRVASVGLRRAEDNKAGGADFVQCGPADLHSVGRSNRFELVD